MNRAQKIARFNLIVIMTALVISAIAVSVLHFVVGLQMRRALGGFGFIGICGLTGLSQLLYKKERDKVSFDERDLMILRRASLGAYSIFWFLFVLAAMIPFVVMGPKGAVSVKYLAAMVFGGMIVVVLVQSIITLELYGCREKGEKP
ncbi:MAG: hypothetical protein GWN67_15810 [Phycisphaerae bacterium]|nr:hypothetical protein [Phycisphaerae bacterium]NIP51655.1 hypothetical protein [Phycisphaerae bacterium]NIS50765.1 hypothetical protein [Phycisphaerae bacterium]NIU08516.1 hypothetical protein [Phycisphaerae bacterium]NIU57798.1 hypothetical protein [Phycisphaerae bacterium]